MIYKNKQNQMRDFVIISLINGSIRPGDSLFEKKFFTSKFKVNPSYVDEVFKELEKEKIITKNGRKYIVCASNEKINWLKVEILHEYISDFMDNISSIGMTVDEAIEILQQRNQANG